MGNWSGNPEVGEAAGDFVCVKFTGAGKYLDRVVNASGGRAHLLREVPFSWPSSSTEYDRPMQVTMWRGDTIVRDKDIKPWIIRKLASETPNIPRHRPMCDIQSMAKAECPVDRLLDLMRWCDYPPYPTGCGDETY